MSGLGTGENRFGSDDGSADAQVAAALAAFGSGTGSEHAALTSLAGCRLLVPLVAAVAADLTEHQGMNAPSAPCGTGNPSHRAGDGEKTSDVALPTLIGKDGRRAIPAFTSLDALTRWRPGARLVPRYAAAVWRAAVEDSCAVVIDVAGPVPLAIEGARLAALARGEAVPALHEDPDVLDAVAKITARQPAIASVSLSPGDAALSPGDAALSPGDAALSPGAAALSPGAAGTDLVIHLALPGCDSASASELAAQVGDGVMALLGGRLRHGITVAVSPAAGDASGAVPARPPAPERESAGHGTDPEHGQAADR